MSYNNLKAVFTTLLSQHPHFLCTLCTSVPVKDRATLSGQDLILTFQKLGADMYTSPWASLLGAPVTAELWRKKLFSQRPLLKCTSCVILGHPLNLSMLQFLQL